MPPAVLREAKKRLVELENRAAASGPQADLFAVAVPPAPTFAAPNQPVLDLIEALDALDPDALSPREALERLYELKRLITG